MAKFLRSTKAEDRETPAWLAANQFTDKLEAYFDAHRSGDIILAWLSGSRSEIPSDIRFPRASNVYTVGSIPIQATRISASQTYTYADIYEQEYTTTEKGDYRGRASLSTTSTPLGGTEIHVDFEREPDKHHSYKGEDYRYVQDTVTFAVEVTVVKRGNGEKIQALTKEVAQGKQMNSSAKLYSEMGKEKYFKMMKNKGVVIAFNIFTFLVMLVALLAVAVLPEFRSSMGRADNQLELMAFKAIFGRDPIPICALLGIDPEITTWCIFGALVVLFIVELGLSFPADDSTAFYQAPLFRYISLAAVGCILVSICAILFFTWVDGEETLATTSSHLCFWFFSI